ncbi:MurR/RpiR family transcriptional regulator [Collinsella provencensis]|uniref:MurR/RpiR family transcriptional regulator n=1 Tax=Collinsella provencensis TaxID=1937461 RepID=UPI000C8467C1|nr:MurR/RpiR family transcriptional regulator [Collinsella provencensis]
MGFFDQINEHVRDLNTNERKVFEYVIHHANQVQDMSIRELAASCFVSSTTILRFTRKLGFSGYREFSDSLKLAQHTAAQSSIPSVLYQKTFSEEYLKDIIESVRVISSSSIEKLCARIEQAHRVYCYGLNLDHEIARYMYQVLLRLGIPAMLPMERLEKRQAIERMQDDDVLLVFSLSGENTEVIEFVERVLSLHSPCVATITQSGKNTLMGMSDFDFYVFYNRISIDGEDLSSRAPMLSLVDYISYGLIKRRQKREQQE